MNEKITPVIEQANLLRMLDEYEYNPKFYGLDEIECAELTANNVTEMLKEEMHDYIKIVMTEYERKLRDTDTLHIFSMLCQHMFAEIDSVQSYYFHECDRTKQAILEQMECHEASTHFEDYMNEPVESQMSDNDVPYENCMNMHNEATSSIECLECNCIDCPYSRG